MTNFIKNIASFIIFNIVAIYGKFNYYYYKRNSKYAKKKSEKKLLRFIEKNKNTEFGKKYGFEKIKSIEDYQKYMPYTTFDNYKEMVARTLNKGEQNLIVKDKICYFAGTSGTTGKIKKIPVVKNSFKPFLKCCSIFSWDLKTIMKQNKKALYGKVFNLSEMGSENTPSGIRLGLISGYFAFGLKHLFPLTTCIPREALEHKEKLDTIYIKARYAIQERNVICINSVYMSSITDLMNYIYNNHDMLIKDIEEGKINNSVNISKEFKAKLEKKLKPDKKRAEELKKIFETPKPEEAFVNKIWKRLALVISICGGEFSPFETKMRKYCGNDISFCYSMYAASEATIACAFIPENKDYTLLYDSGFYEFIPTEGAEKPLLMDQLEIGKTYEIIITNYAGLYRYRINDIIRVVGYENNVPLLHFAYRKNQVTSIGGIHLTVETLAMVINNIEKETKVNILDYSAYVNTSTIPRKLEIFIEFEKNLSENINLSEIFNQKLIELNENYRQVYHTVTLGKSVVHIVKTGTYEKFRENKTKNGAIGNQIKTVRIIEKQEDLNYFLNAIK